jgi:hypothetical protein
MRSSVGLLSVVCSVAVLACGGKPLVVSGTGGAGGTGTAGDTGTAGATSETGSAGASGSETGICHAGCLCYPLKDCPPGCYASPEGNCQNGPSPDGTSIRVPTVHRSASATCAAQRGPGSPMCSGEAGLSLPQCGSDGDCRAGMNGRCSFPDGPPPTCMRFCSYDECQSDADCPTKVPCECRDSPSSSEANLCVTGGNCAVDSDCGPGGFCSPGLLEGLCVHPIYFCHTPKDTCTDDGDCPMLRPGVGETCNYDAQAGHFACGPPCFQPA